MTEPARADAAVMSPQLDQDRGVAAVSGSALPAGHPAVQAQRTGVLLLNLGTPDATDYWSMRRYLKEFLSDERVIDVAALRRRQDHHLPTRDDSSVSPDLLIVGPSAWWLLAAFISDFRRLFEYCAESCRGRLTPPSRRGRRRKVRHRFLLLSPS